MSVLRSHNNKTRGGLIMGRLIMNSRWLWNSHQRHKFLRAEASRHILKFSLGNGISRGFQEVISTLDTLFCQNKREINRLFKITTGTHKLNYLCYIHVDKNLTLLKFPTIS